MTVFSLFYVLFFFPLSVVPPTKLLDMKHLTPSEKKAAQAQAYELYTVFGTGVIERGSDR